MVRTNYVIATWSGKRRSGSVKSLHYLTVHLKFLEKYKHQLEQITIVSPDNPRENLEFTEFLKNIPNKIGTAKVVLLRRENFGQSYGSFAYAYQMFSNEFDYYIFIEDDYVFIRDDFDGELISKFNEIENCGYLCSLVNYFERQLHAAIPIGITSTEVLKKIWDTFDRIPCGEYCTSSYPYSAAPQLRFSKNFLDIGRTLSDLIDHYRAPFNAEGKLEFYGDKHKKDLIVPIQFMKELIK